MPPEIRIEIRRLAHLPRLGLTGEAEVTIITDLRDTPWGVFDFGSKTCGPIRWVRDSTPD